MFKEQYGPWALIAGGSDGIGAAFARELASRGLNVALIARNAATLDALAGEIRAAHPGIEVRTLPVDLSHEQAIDTITSAVADIDIGCFVYNVGSEPSYGDFLDKDLDFVLGRMNRNFVVKAALTHHFGQKLRARGRGGVILMGSMSGYFGNPGFALYSASKAFTRYFTEALWYELKKGGVDVLCPIVGPTDTPSMVKSYGKLENASDPVDVARGALDNMTNGPVWVSDDIAAQIAAMEAMTPAQRATLSAQWAEDFVLKGKKPSLETAA